MTTDNLHLLLADDDDDDRFLFREVLKDISPAIKVSTVNDGDQLIEHLEKNCKELPHALFLDLNMPRKNGYESLTEIKKREQFNHLPVIIYTTSYEPDIADLLYENDARLYIRKPSDYDDLKAVIQHALTQLTQGQLTQPPRDQFVLGAS